MTHYPPNATGAHIAQPAEVEIAAEADAMRVKKLLSDGINAAFERMDAQPKQRILDFWTPSDRRRLGHLSFKAYEQASMNCPTDLWTYQRLFIEQRRDVGNLWSAQPAVAG
jgi:hypothetical protein